MRKFTKKAVSLAVASLVTVTSVFTGSTLNANAATTSILATTNNQNETYKVTFTAPSSWTGTVYAYAYYDETDSSGKITTQKPLGIWPGKAMTKNSDGTYSIEVSTAVGSANMVFANVTVPLPSTPTTANPEQEGSEDYYDIGENVEQLPKKELNTAYTVTGDCKISSSGDITKVTPTVAPTTEPTKTPEVTATAKATKEPTAAPTVTPVSGPQVTVSEANGTSYYEETSDTLSVIVDLAEGATSATYSVDNGPKTTITSKTVVKLGEGKIANSAISLKVESTDGTTTNTQEFTYYKKSKASESAINTKRQSVSTSMVSLFSTVKALASSSSQAKVLPVHFKIPAADWEAQNRTVYCYAYYVENGRIERPLDIWPGEAMTKKGDYYEVNIDAPTGSVQLVFSSVIGTRGDHYYPGETLKDGTKAVEEHYDCNVFAKLPYGYTGPNTDQPREGIMITDETWIAQSGTDSESLTITKTVPVTPIPSTATPIPTASATPDAGKETPDPSASPEAPVSTELSGYFGASLSAPQYNTTAQTLSAIALHATGKVTYSFSVDGEEIYSGSNSTLDWNTTALTEGSHVIGAKITDGEGNVWEDTKNYTISVDSDMEEPTATPEVTVAPTEEPTPTPEVTVAPTIEPTVVPTIEPTATVPADVDIKDGDISNQGSQTTGSAITSSGSIAVSFNKKSKTVGETIKVKAAVTGIDEAYTLSYSVKRSGGTTKYLAKKVKKKTVSWTPTKKGTYTVTVRAYNKDGQLIVTGKTTYKVKKRVINIKSIKPASTKVGRNTTIKITGKTTTGTLKIKAVIKNNKNKTVKTKKYSKKKTFTWKPSKKGTYTITITAKNGKGVVVSKSKTIKVKK